MSKPKLINQLKAKNPNLNNSEIEQILDIFLDSIKNALQHRKNVDLRNFGRFYCKKLKENFRARNPKTNELIYKPERVTLRFKASNNFKKLLNE